MLGLIHGKDKEVSGNSGWMTSKTLYGSRYRWSTNQQLY